MLGIEKKLVALLTLVFFTFSQISPLLAGPDTLPFEEPLRPERPAELIPEDLITPDPEPPPTSLSFLMETGGVLTGARLAPGLENNSPAPLRTPPVSPVTPFLSCLATGLVASLARLASWREMRQGQSPSGISMATESQTLQ